MSHRRPLAMVVGLAAVGALLVGSWAAAQFRSATLGRPWFVAPSQLAVAPDGTLYVGVGEREIQVYAADGTPRAAWYTGVPGPFRLRLGSEGEGVELVFEDDRVTGFDAEGGRRAERREPGAFEGAGRPQREGVAADGTRFALRGEGLILDASPPRVLVPSPPLPLAWFGRRPLLPITGVLLASLLGFVVCVGLARSREER